MNKKKLVLQLVVILFFAMSLSGVVAYAENDGSRVSIDVIHPDNQLDNSAEYFDLQMKPSQKQKVLMKLTNHTSEKINMRVTYNPAKTTSVGDIEYSENDRLMNTKSLKHEFSKVVSGPKKVVLPPGKTTDVPVEIKMPAEEFDGYLAGGVEFSEKKDKKESNTSAIVTEYSYLIGVRLSETTKDIPDKIELDQVAAALSDYQNAIIATFSNNTNMYVEDMLTDVKIVKKGNSEVLLQARTDDMRMAPNSLLEFPIYLDENILEVGDYSAEIKLETKKGFTEKWQKDFTITKNDISMFTKNDEQWNGTEPSDLKSVVILIIVCVILVIAISILVYLKLKKKTNDNDEKK